MEVEVGDPGFGEIQLQGGACGICSWDIVTCKLGDEITPKAPPGHEGMGIVTKLKPLITHKTDLEGYPELMAKIISGDPTYLKGVVTL